MMREKLKAEVCKANLDLVAEGLVIQTWGNVVIKPSGVPYNGMKPEHMAVVSLKPDKVVEGKLRPSSETPTHLVLYRAFPKIGNLVHTQSLFATVWAQAHAVYQQLCAFYKQLHDAFGTKEWNGSLYDVMKKLLEIRNAQRQ
jgi:L-ribulose-5-phosphate 4-epimerase